MISNFGLDFIISWEKFRSKAYLDQAKIWTIGFGIIRYTNGKKVKKGDIMSLPIANIYLQAECDGIAEKLNAFLNKNLAQHKFDALVSIAYNIGTQGLKTSTLLREINKDNIIIENHFTRWNKVTIDGKLVVSKGLIRRRKSEFQLFKEADYTGNE